jgi:hypothetical protein
MIYMKYPLSKNEMVKGHMKRFVSSCVVLAVIWFAGIAPAQEEKPAARVTRVSGAAQIKFKGQTGWVDAGKDVQLHEGDEIKTAPGSWMIIRLEGKTGPSTVEVKENSHMIIAQYVKEEGGAAESVLLDLAIGEVLIKTPKLFDPKSKFQVKTPTSVAGVRGTDFSVKVESLEKF